MGKFDLYKIVIRTNGYQASRNGRYRWQYDEKRNAEATIQENLTLKEAQKLLVEFWNEDFENHRGSYLPNWGLIRANYPNETSTHKDGTRSYDYDGYCVCIEKQENKIVTMKDLADYINSQTDFPLDVSDIIEDNGWESDLHIKHGICHNDEEKCVFVAPMIAAVVPID